MKVSIIIQRGLIRRSNLSIINKIKELHAIPSPLEGEGYFQYEQKPASIRKLGEGYRNECMLFTPHHFSSTRE